MLGGYVELQRNLIALLGNPQDKGCASVVRLRKQGTFERRDVVSSTLLARTNFRPSMVLDSLYNP